MSITLRPMSFKLPNDALIAPLCFKNVKMVTFSMHPDKVPGFDGCNLIIYHKF